MSNDHQDNVDPVYDAFSSGQLLVYPTEAVMGIGCDPMNEEAVNKVLEIKQRPVEKGLILIAHNYSQLLPYVNDSAISQDRRTAIFSAWPGAITWLLPVSASAPKWITGQFDKIAVRVTAHPVAAKLCADLNSPLVSTSANPSGLTPALTRQQAESYFADKVFYIDGEVGGNSAPSKIIDGESGTIIRE